MPIWQTAGLARKRVRLISLLTVELGSGSLAILFFGALQSCFCFRADSSGYLPNSSLLTVYFHEKNFSAKQNQTGTYSRFQGANEYPWWSQSHQRPPGQRSQAADASLDRSEIGVVLSGQTRRRWKRAFPAVAGC